MADLLVTRYPPGAGIGWHRDAPQFGEVSGVSLLTACRMRFRRGRPRAWETAELTLEPRSAYLLSGPARARWQHRIPPVTQERWSITSAPCGTPRPAHGEREYAEAADRARPREGTYRAPGVGRFDAPLVGPRPARRRAGKRRRDPRRGAVGRRRAVSGDDRLGRDRTPQTRRDPARGHAPSASCLTGSPPRRPEPDGHLHTIEPGRTDQPAAGQISLTARDTLIEKNLNNAESELGWSR